VTDMSVIDSKWRQALFLEMASRDNGITAQEVHDEAARRGDTATVEAYLNLGRRLALRGRLNSSKDDARTRDGSVREMMNSGSTRIVSPISWTPNIR